MAPSSFFHKPELALRRAIELQGINQDAAALELLHEVLSARRHRTWSPVYEQIMITYLDLCLAGHKSREAKDGLHQYRNLSQSQAPGSLEKVILYLMNKAEAACTEAKANVDAEQLAETAVEDEDGDGFGASPQAILLSTMSTDPAKSQRDSTLLLPSLKFLWETYRAILDILRSNSKLEHVYHTAAQGALKFCRVYHRRMEFRHLCDMLRMHLGNLRQFGSVVETEEGKSHSKVRGWEGWSADSIELNLATRFAQLEAASVLHRYTEGFRTVEDIYNILQISQARRKANPDAPPPKAKLMAAYYEKLTTLFWVSENHLFHGFAWYKYYTLCKEFNRSMSEDEKRMQASAVLLAALCIPPTPSNLGKPESKQHGIRSTIEDDIVKQKMTRMATLLGFHTRNPTREALLTEIRAKNILGQVPEYLRELYFLLEETSDPLTMVEKARPLLEQLKEEIGSTTSTDKENDDVADETLSRYVKPLAHVLLLKLVVNLSAAYHTVSIDHLKKLTTGLDMTFEQVEKSIVQFTQTKMLSVRIDHRAGCLRFGDPNMESDVMRSQLTVLSKQLQVVSLLLNPPDASKIAAERISVLDKLRESIPQEHEAILDRKNYIERKKEEVERLAQEKAKEEKRIRDAEESARKAEEEKRIARDQKLREQEKLKKIQQELENKEKMRFLAAMGKKTEDITEEQMAEIDTEALQREHQAKINTEKEEAERKTHEAAKKLDYLVRAVRIAELPLIQKAYDETVKRDRELYEHETIEKAEKAKAQWEADIKDKRVLEEHSVFQYFSTFEEAVMRGRKVKYDALCAEADREAEIEAEKGKIRRARMRRDDEIRRKADEEAILQEEEERAKAEEATRKKEEARREREAKEEEARQAERRRMEEETKREESKAGNTYIPPSMRRGGGGGGGGGGPDDRRYPGGGRYEGRSGGGFGDRRGEDRDGGFDDRGGSGDRDRGGYGDRRSGGYADRRPGNDRGESREGGGGGNSRWQR